MATLSRTTFQRLLRYPHRAVFDKQPAQELALRVNHALGCSWVVRDEVLTVTVTGGAEYEYDLTAYTLTSLATELRADGFDTPYISGTLKGLGAAVLIDGSGNQGESNGDHLYAFTSLLWVILSVYASLLKAAGVAKDEALRQMVIPQAEDYWLDVWGQLYGIGRNEDELDADYAGRIPEEAFRIRVNALAIEKAILDITGKDVRIKEPWQQIFRLDRSKLSGQHRFFGGGRLGYHIIQPVSMTPIEWDDVLAVIERNRPAGVIVLEPLVGTGGLIEAEIDGTAWSLGTTIVSSSIEWLGSDPIGVMRLSVDGIDRYFRAGGLTEAGFLTLSAQPWDALGEPWPDAAWSAFFEEDALAGDVFSAASESS